jgi:ribose/xylose/arabinose/galactoside ABC-type transport system permease subunit
MIIPAGARRVAWPLIGIAGLLLGDLIFGNDFFNLRMQDGHLYGNLIDILRFGAVPLLVALGMTFVIATGGVDLSVGAIVAISGALACYIIRGGAGAATGGGLEASGGRVALAIVAALALSTALGLWNGLLVAVIGIQPIVATLILMVAGRGIAQLITSGQIITINSPDYNFIENGYVLLPFAVFIAAAVYLIAGALSRRTALGMLIESVGGNAEASRLAGIRSRGIIILVYMFSGLCSGIAGLMVSSGINGADANNAGLWFELDAIAAVVIGGTSLMGGRFFLAGTAIGALLIQTLVTTIYATGVPPETSLLFKAVVVTAVVLLQSPVFRAKLMAVRGRRTERAVSVEQARETGAEATV